MSRSSGPGRGGTKSLDTSTRAFDIADILEAGFARETCTEYLRPFRRGSRMFRCYITRSDDKSEYTMYTENADGRPGRFVMHAKFVTPHRVHLVPYHPEDRLFDLQNPAFVLTGSADGREWTLRNERCEACEWRTAAAKCDKKEGQQVVHMRHRTESAGRGVFTAMEIHVPGLWSDGGRVVWCPREGYPPLGHLLPDGTEHPHGILLRSKPPHWNSEIESLVLDFHGRQIQPSAKNFQIALAKRPDYLIVQYGKITSNIFILDFRYPLSIVQAFAIALSTYHWK